ncbi:hypothetical protein [Novipirellula artificiosorum]|uniref:Tetratricopeptide repeat protein n=1 Tax=Novipirellula artificiosorum TaxID=2528016 RepID=A0A5C6D9W5_9BACT|nr:hypothetical protein [Novipirellula artificiosorum]TWU32026.1 hypothetical protein Poly41_59140 [Novipirellula artificiosorum]
MELALKAAQRASEIRADKDASILDTLARCHYELDHLEEAIKWQQLAVEQGDGNKQIQDTLQNYLDEAEKSKPKVEANEETESSNEKESESEESKG